MYISLGQQETVKYWGQALILYYFQQQMKKMDVPSQNRKNFKYEGHIHSEASSGDSSRNLKAVGITPKTPKDSTDPNDAAKRMEARISTHNSEPKIHPPPKKPSQESYDLNDYKGLHEKLNLLENKILKMKSNIQKKREDKKEFLETQQRERKDRERRREETKSQQRGENSLKKLVTQVQPASLKGLVTQVPQQKDLRYFDFNPYSPRSNIYYVSEISKAYREEKSLAREHLLTSMQHFRTLENSRKNAPKDLKPLNLPKHSSHKDKKTIVFDLDETLIHCNENSSIPHDVKLPIRFPTGELIQAGINIRPYARELLRNLASKFEIIVFTASHSCYANVVLDYLDPENNLIQHRLYREHCYPSPEGMYIKDLRIINRNLSDMVLVDNAAYSYAYQIDNGIPILPFYDAKHDFELVALEKYLDTLLLSNDVRESNRKTFKLQMYSKYQDLGKLVQELYLDSR